MKRLCLAACLVLVLPGIIFAAGTDTAAVEVLAKTSSSWENTSLPAYTQGMPEITILRITIPAGATLPAHKHPVINAGVLTKGALTVVTEDSETLHLRAGEAIIEVVDKWHYGKNEGDIPAEIIVFYAGVKDVPITVTGD